MLAWLLLSLFSQCNHVTKLIFTKSNIEKNHNNDPIKQSHRVILCIKEHHTNYSIIAYHRVPQSNDEIEECNSVLPFSPVSQSVL